MRRLVVLCVVFVFVQSLQAGTVSATAKFLNSPLFSVTLHQPCGVEWDVVVAGLSDGGTGCMYCSSNSVPPCFKER